MAKQFILERYHASMLLSGAGDALGFKNGRWEFCYDGEKIHVELAELGGLEKINVSLPRWKLSDDTIMHIATAEGLIEKSNSPDKEELYLMIAKKYKECMNDMFGRSPGFASRGNAYAMQPDKPKGYHIPFDERGGGCGAAMRAMCIGLRYPSSDEQDVDKLIAVAVETGRMTHHHPTGFLGSLAAALFTSFAVQGKPVKSWGHCLMSVLPKAKVYVESQERYVKENVESWSYFTDHWQNYLKLRGIEDGVSEPEFPQQYDVVTRDKFYKSLSYCGWGGASGHDAPIIAYDGLLAAGADWDKLCKHAMFHGGDSDSTGVIAGACFGAMYGFEGVPPSNYQNIEYKDRISNLAIKLYQLSHPDENMEKELTTNLPEVPSDSLPEAESATGASVVSHEQIQIQIPESQVNQIKSFPSDHVDSSSSNIDSADTKKSSDNVDQSKDQSQEMTEPSHASCEVALDITDQSKEVSTLSNDKSQDIIDLMGKESSAKVPKIQES